MQNEWLHKKELLCNLSGMHLNNEASIWPWNTCGPGEKASGSGMTSERCLFVMSWVLCMGPLLAPLEAAGAEAGRATLSLAVNSVSAGSPGARYFVWSAGGQSDRTLASTGCMGEEKKLSLPPGVYDVLLWHGPERRPVARRLALEKGGQEKVTASFGPRFALPGWFRVDPMADHFIRAPLQEADLEQAVEDLDAMLALSDLGPGVAEAPRRHEGLFQRAGVCPFSGIAEKPALLDGLWGMVLGHGGEAQPAAGWHADLGTGNALRMDWFHRLARGHYPLALIAGAKNGAIPGMPRLYVPAPALSAVPDAIRRGRSSIAWGLVVQLLNARGELPEPLMASPYGRVTLRVKVFAPPWVSRGRLVLYEGGNPVLSADLKNVEAPLRLDRTFVLRSRFDTFYVAAASARGGPPFLGGDRWRPLGISGPVRVDGDGDGAFTTAQDYAAARSEVQAPARLLNTMGRWPRYLTVQWAATCRDPVLLDHLADVKSDMQVRLSALSAIKRFTPDWGPDILVRRMEACQEGGALFEMGQVVTALAACGKATGLDTFADMFARATLAERIKTYRALMFGSDAVSPVHWDVLGPFPDPDRRGVRLLLGPERGARAGQAFKDYHGQAVTWREAETPHGLLTFSAKPESAVNFALAAFRMKRGGKLLFLMSAPAGIQVWLDDDPVLTLADKEAAAVAVSRYLPRGEHRLFIKAAVQPGRRHLGCRILDPGKVMSFEK